MNWDSNLECGIEQIDAEHKSLVRMVNEMLEACKTGQAKEAGSEALAFLADYVVTHFAHEEWCMIQSNYPDYKKHKRIHEDFATNFLSLKNTHDTSDDTLAISLEINRTLTSWLLNHIKVTDFRFAQYYKENMLR